MHVCICFPGPVSTATIFFLEFKGGVVSSPIDSHCNQDRRGQIAFRCGVEKDRVKFVVGVVLNHGVNMQGCGDGSL